MEAALARFHPASLIVPLALLTPAFLGRDLPLPPGFQGQVDLLLGRLKRATRVDRTLQPREGLVLLGRAVVPQVARALEKAGRKARWSLLEVLGLLGGPEAGRTLKQVLIQPRWRARKGCVCLAALGIPLETKLEAQALADLAETEGERKAWLRICGLLGLSRPYAAGLELPPLPAKAWSHAGTPQEKAAVLLFLGRKGSGSYLSDSLARFWPAKRDSWGSRLVSRACCLAVASRKEPGWKGPFLAWLGSGKTRPEDRQALALALGALGVPPGAPSLRFLSSPREWASYFSLASLAPGKKEFQDLIEARLDLPALDPILKGALAGAFARSLPDATLLQRAPSFVGASLVREVLVLELARRVLRARKGDPFLRKAGNRTWDPGHGTESYLVAALASRGVLQARGPLPAGWSLWAKAVRGEVPPPVAEREVEKALRRRGAWPGQLLEAAQEEEARAILYGASELYLQKYPSRAPARGKGPLPPGAPAGDSPFYGWLDSFLAAHPLFRKGNSPKGR